MGTRKIIYYLLFDLDRFISVSGVWNAKLTKTQIYRELSIEIESSLFN